MIRRLGEYRVVGRLGDPRTDSAVRPVLLRKAQPGDVLLARDQTGREVILKVLDGAVGDKEVLIARCGRLAAVPDAQVPVRRAVGIGSLVVVEMARVPRARPAAALFARDAPLAPHAAVDIINKAADAIETAAVLGEPHGYLSMSHVLEGQGTAQGTVAVIGWEASGPREDDLRLLRVTAPELLSREGTPDRRSDVYSLACLLIELLTGSPAFAGTTAAELVAMIKDGRASLGPITGPLRAVLERAISTDPADRHHDAAEFGVEAAAAAANAPGPRIAHPPPPDPLPPVRNPRWPVVIGATLGIFVALFFIVEPLWFPDRHPPAGPSDGPVSVGKRPVAVATAPGGLAFVGNFADGTVTVLGGSNPEPIDVGGNPTDVAVDGNTLYVSDQTSGVLDIVDIAKRKIAAVRVPDPRGIAVEPGGVLVASRAGSVLSVDAGGALVGAPIPVPGQVVDVAVEPGGTAAYALTHGPDAVVELDLVSRRAGRSVMLPAGSAAEAVVVAAGVAWVSDPPTGSVLGIDLGTLAVARVRIGGSVRGMAVDSVRNALYVVSRRPDRIAVVDLDTRTVLKNGIDLDFSPEDVAPSPDGRELIVTDPVMNTARRLQVPAR